MLEFNLSTSMFVLFLKEVTFTLVHQTFPGFLDKNKALNLKILKNSKGTPLIFVMKNH